MVMRGFRGFAGKTVVIRSWHISPRLCRGFVGKNLPDCRDSLSLEKRM